MSIGALLAMGIVFLLFPVLDLVMLVTLVMPGDERNQVIVWKASAFTLLATMGGMLLDVLVAFLQGLPLTANPLIQLETAATLYFIALLFYKKRHGG